MGELHKIAPDGRGPCTEENYLWTINGYV